MLGISYTVRTASALAHMQLLRACARYKMSVVLYGRGLVIVTSSLQPVDVSGGF